MKLNVWIYLVFSMMISSTATFAQIELLGNGDAILQADNDEPDLFFRNSLEENVSSLCVTFDRKMHILMADLERMTFDASGNVGIGTISPTARLHVIGADESGPAIRINTGNISNLSDNKPGLYMRKNNGTFAGAVYGDVANEAFGIDLKIEANDDINFTTGNDPTTSKMFIDDAGNVGIGSSTPSAKLSVVHQSSVDDGQLKLIESTGGFARINFQNLAFPSRYWTILASATSTTNSFILSHHNGTRGRDWFNYSPTNLDVFINGSLIRMDYPDEPNDFDIGADFRPWRNIYATNGTIQTSDARTKKNIKKLNYGLEEILKMRPVSFEWKENSHGEQKLGLIAQELHELVPETVKTHKWVYDKKEGASKAKKVPMERLGVYYSDLIPVLIRGMQEQQDIIKNQETILTTQEAKMEGLEKKVSDLTALVENLLATHTIENRSIQTLQLGQKASMSQNQPNPFHQQTEIQYYLPSSVTVATLHISDLKGNVLKTYPLTGTGIGKVMLDAGQLTSGMYTYTLTLDGKLVDTKQMVLTK